MNVVPRPRKTLVGPKALRRVVAVLVRAHGGTRELVVLSRRASVASLWNNENPEHEHDPAGTQDQSKPAHLAELAPKIQDLLL